MLLALALAGLWAGAQNALAGGGSFVTLPVLLLAGLDPRAANIASTVALFPGQVAAGYAGRAGVRGAERLPFVGLFGLSLVGGAIGALLLLATPSDVFGAMLPWLVLAATVLFAYGSFGFRPTPGRAALPVWVAGTGQFAIGVYGGYFGGGIGFFMLAALTLAGMGVKNAGATKNALAGVMNASAVAIFVFSGEVAWAQAAALCAGSLVGYLGGNWALSRVNEKALRVGIVVLGLVLTAGLFARAAGLL